MSNLSIAVLSRNRPFGDTFKWIKNTNYPVFVYVHSPEEKLYKDLLPKHWTIVPHDFDTIGAIRNFVHSDQAERNNKVMILDDDILGFYYSDFVFMVDFETIADYASKQEADLVMSIGYYSKEMKTTLCGMYVMFPHTTDIKMATGKYDNEDTDAYLQFVFAEKKIELLPYIAHHVITANSHFTKNWLVISAVNLYKKWGDLCEYEFIPQAIRLIHKGDISKLNDKAELKKRQKKIVYTKKGHKAILDCIECYERHYDDGSADELIKNLKEIYATLPDINSLED